MFGSLFIMAKSNEINTTRKKFIDFLENTSSKVEENKKAVLISAICLGIVLFLAASALIGVGVLIISGGFSLAMLFGITLLVASLAIISVSSFILFLHNQDKREALERKQQIVNAFDKSSLGKVVFLHPVRAQTLEDSSWRDDAVKKEIKRQPTGEYAAAWKEEIKRKTNSQRKNSI